LNNQKKIILFDGVCNFCNFWVNFVIKRDKKDLFRFAPIQSEKARELMARFEVNISNENPDTFILIDGEKFFTKSTAALMVCKQLNGMSKILFLLIILPEFFRDFVYDLIAANRYKLFGKKETCRVPAEEGKAKFLI
jgi:predicted DCC family thiol-disulfide oxidoreductase YuxK